MRLAHAQGLLSQPNLNRFQHWALLYWLYLSQRSANEEASKHLEIQCFNLAFDRWQELYLHQPHSTLTPAVATEDGDVPVDDIDEVIRFYEQMEHQRSMSGGDLPMQAYDPTAGWTSDDSAWGEWH